MRYVAKSTRTTWRTTAAEIAAALGIPAEERGWFVLEDAELEISGSFTEVDVVRWVPHVPFTYQDEMAHPAEEMTP